MKYKEDFEPLSDIEIKWFRKDSKVAKDYLKSFSEFKLFRSYIDNKLAADFACRVAETIANNRKYIISLQAKIDEQEG